MKLLSSDAHCRITSCLDCIREAWCEKEVSFVFPWKFRIFLLKRCILMHFLLFLKYTWKQPETFSRPYVTLVDFVGDIVADTVAHIFYVGWHVADTHRRNCRVREKFCRTDMSVRFCRRQNRGVWTARNVYVYLSFVMHCDLDLWPLLNCHGATANSHATVNYRILFSLYYTCRVCFYSLLVLYVILVDYGK